MKSTNLGLKPRLTTSLAVIAIGGLLTAGVVSAPAALAAPTAASVAAAPTAERASTLQIYKDRAAINKAYRAFMTLIFDPSRISGAASELAEVGFPLDGTTEAQQTAQATALLTAISAKNYVGTPAEKIITKYYGKVNEISRTQDGSKASAAAAVFIASIVAEGSVNWPLPKRDLLTWESFAVNGNSATIHGREVIGAAEKGVNPNMSLAKLTKVKGKWLIELDAEPTAKTPKKISTTVTGWKSGKATVRKGKSLKSRTVVVKAATGKVVLQKQAAGSKKWSKAASFKANAKTGVATVKFPKATKAGKVSYRITYDGGAYYKAKTSKPLTVTAK